MNLTLTDVLLRHLDCAYDRKAWHGPTLRGALRGVDEALASWRPAPDRHNIWELAVHAAYWKYSVRRRLLDEATGSFPLEGSNWFERPDLSRSWKADLQLLEEMHRTLREAAAGFDPERLNRVPPGSKTRYLDLLLGVASHDVYHTGQIQLLKRLFSESRQRNHAGSIPP